jgi:tetratricopeptide (TPR) repeat protein
MAKVYLRSYNREIEKMVDGGLFQEAVAHSLHILKTYPKHLDTYRLLGKAYLELKQYTDATDIFTRLLSCVPNDFVANVGMGIIRDEENKLDDAIWHMERAFETQPSNPAIQSEMQRLYARRDGSAPPRIRMTRGALAQMYLQGELYPQAISETKAVLTEDPGRMDMQVLLSRAHFRSGQKTEAAEVASSLLRRYPYCLDANRVLAEILGADRPDNAELYRQRVFELDPYAAQVTGSLFQSSDAPESAVAMEKLDWNGQPVGMPPDWRETRAISLPGAEARDEQPDWLQRNYDKEDTVPPKPFVGPAPVAFPASGADDNIPDFMRKHGWSENTGVFDESKPVFADGEAQPAAIPAGDLPDWVKDMAPAEALAPPGEKEEMPDWMNRINPGILDTPAESTYASADQPDWLKGLGEPSYDAPSAQPAAADEPDWLKGIGEPSYNASTEQPAAEQPAGDQLDWMKDLGGSESMAQPAVAADDQPEWLKQETIEPAKAEAPASDLSPEKEATAQPHAMTETPPATEKDMDDSFAWLESLAVKQGATEGLLMKPEERLEQEPDWVKQAKSLTGEPEQPATIPSPVEVPPPFVEAEVQPPADIESLGKTEQEQDESFSWLENLAAKHGATEGLLTRPEDRLEQEPDWVKQAKDISEDEAPAPTGQQSLSGGMDTATWLRSLDQDESPAEPAAESPADETSMWLKGLDAEAKHEPAMESGSDETSMWLKGLDAEAKHEPAIESGSDDTSIWLKGLDETETGSETAAEPADDTSMWLKSLDKPEAVPEPASTASDLPDWMQSLEMPKEEPEAEPAVPEEVRAEPVQSEADWLRSFEEPESAEVPRIDTGNLPSWLRGVDQDEAQVSTQDDLPAWLRDDTGEVVTEPTTIEPTRADEWQPVDEVPPPPVEKPKPAQKRRPERAEGKKTAPVARKAEAQPEPYREPATRKGVGVLTTDEDPILGTARTELTRSNIPGALDTYSKLIKRGRFLDEVIFDLREALYRYPVEVSIWQSLGDAYMRANRLQDALDAYTKAEELLR